MKLSQVVLLDAVRDLVKEENTTGLSAAEDTRYGGYTLMANELGVVASHPKSTKRRLIPWARIRYTDVLIEERPHAVQKPEAARVDARKQTRDGEKVGGRHAQGQEASDAGEE